MFRSAQYPESSTGKYKSDESDTQRPNQIDELYFMRLYELRYRDMLLEADTER
jgi:hypothetical protein